MKRLIQSPALLFLMVVQVAIVAYICISTLINIPFEDDYIAVLGFVRELSEQPTLLSKTVFVFTHQFSQYTLMFMQSVLALQYAILGHVSLPLLQVIGDAAPFVALFILWKFAERPGRSVTQQAWLSLIVCMIFFAPRYSGTFNWAMSGLQNLAVIPFVLGAIFWFEKRTNKGDIAGLLCLLLSIATSGNGFVAAIVCIGSLLFQQRYRIALISVLSIIALGFVYFSHYHNEAHASKIKFPVAIALILDLLGGGFCSTYKAVVLGTILIVIFLVLMFKGWYKTDSRSFLAATFCLVTALGIGATRTEFGWLQGEASRYQIYSLTFFSCEVLGAAALLQNMKVDFSLPRWRYSLALFTFLCICFALRSDRNAYRSLRYKNAVLESHLKMWQEHPDQIVLISDEEEYKKLPEWVEKRKVYQAEFARDVELGLFYPPQLVPDAPRRGDATK